MQKKRDTADEPKKPSLKKKLVIVGNGATGKTSLLFRFTRGKMMETYIPTVFDNHAADITVNGIHVELGLWDTSGQEDYDRLRPLSYPDSDVIIVTYTVDNPESFICVEDKWVPEIRHFCPKVPMLLVATKVDLRDDEYKIKVLAESKESAVTLNEGRELAQKIGAYSFVECSAKTGVGACAGCFF